MIRTPPLLPRPPRAARALRAPPVPRMTGHAVGASAISSSAAARSAGVRIIYYFVTRRGAVFLLDAYAKSDKENLTDAETREIRKLIASIEAEEWRENHRPRSPADRQP